MNGFQQAQNIYDTNSAKGPYSGTLYPGQNSQQTGSADQASAFANGTGNLLPYQTAQTSSNLMGAAPNYLNNASQMASNGAGQASPLTGVLNGYANGTTPAVSTDPNLSSALNSAAINGAGTLQGFTNGQQQVMNQSLMDPTQQLAANAGTYMNSSAVQGAIKSTNDQINQQLTEQTVPGLNRQAAMGGALNSSRAGMAESMANEGAAIATGNADSQILNNAWNTGLSTAAAERNAGLTTGMYAANSGLAGNSSLAQGQQAQQASQSEFGTNTALGAAQTGLNYNLGMSGLNASTRLQANGQLGSAINLGINGATSAGGQAANNFNLGSGAGGVYQQGLQTSANNAYAQWQNQNQYQQGLLNNYWNVVSNLKGTAGTSGGNSTTSGPGGVAGALGTAAGLGGLYNMAGGSTGALASGAGAAATGVGNLAAGYAFDGMASGAGLAALSSAGGMSAADALAAGLIAL